MRRANLNSWLLAAPLTGVLVVFLILPILLIVAVSFWSSNEFSFYPDFQFGNYEYLFGSAVAWKVFGLTFMMTVIVWALTLVIGFTIAFFLAFHVRTQKWQMALFLLTTIPFWTSNIIRMISWIPLLGKNGLMNQTLIGAGIINEPIQWLLYSSFSVCLAFVHLYTLFMVVPIFNTMMRIDKSLIEAARDSGASGFQILTNVIIPLSKPGIMIGSVFVIALVMSDFVTTRFMSGSQLANVGRLISNDIGLLQYPSAAATAVVLLITVLLMIGAMLRLVDIRKEL
ncbi:ABC transporter permease [Pseudotabrizicola sp. 4114]|uniref:ABC transporter permease n=1 Tax=Pseudotabrizicola sp. 4114 TaxID=2817731 RepID=UPI0028612109|nr:putative spermidine/putrescine transport system permease protein [Pseudorhodobacter sp. 4114]